MEKKKTHTLRKNIIRVLISIAVLQVTIFTGVIILFGTVEQLDSNAEQGLKDVVKAQGQKLEEKMGSWSSMPEIVSKVNEISEAYCQENSIQIEDVMSDSTREIQLIQRYTPTILNLLRVSGTTGSFIILNGPQGSIEKYGLYFRDLDPQIYSKDDGDILVEAGPGEFLINSGYTLDSLWKTRLSVTGESDFYHKPYDAALEYGDTIDANNLGYWSPSFRMKPNDIEIITYTIPLVTDQGKVYGVMGIGVSLDYLKSMVNSGEIVVDNNAGMLIANYDEEQNPEAYHTCMVSGSQYQSVFAENPSFTVEKGNNQLYDVHIKDKEHHTASIYELRLYNTNTPFENEGWALMGITHTQALRHASRNLIFRLAVSAIVALLMSVMIALLFAFKVTRPIYGLMQGISTMNDANAHLPKTNIVEFNELGQEIEKRNRAIWESTNKTANIIKMTNLSLGVFEYDEFTERNFCTEKILEFFEIDKKKSSWNNNYVDHEEMMEEMTRNNERLTLEQDEKEVFYYEMNDHSKRWIRVRRVGTPRHYLCVIQDVTDEMNEKQKIKHERDYDVLTDLYNRRAFQREVNKVLLEKPDTTGVMSIWDLDNLKYMNDTYGHDMGDRYIALLATVFKRVERTNVLISRMSGDEFMMFIYDENVARICEIMRDVHRAFLAEKITVLDGTELSVSASAGMAIYPNDATTYRNLMTYADFAMYEVKNNEKGAIKLFNREHYVKDYILVQGVGELTRILNEEKIKYVFQPIVDVHTKEIYAYEALLRPVSDLLKGPDELIRLAESQSKLRQIEVLTWMHAIKEYTEQLKRSKNTGTTKLFLNSTPGQSLNEGEFQYLEEHYEYLLPQIVMEVTEIAKTDEKQEAEKYAWCRKHHIMVALDDYGSGYSNNDVLVSRELDFVKLDMSIIRDIHMIPARQRLVKGMIDYCHEKNIRVIAEGVERKKELDEVIRLGADYVQGYYLARPQEHIFDFSDGLSTLFED